MMVGGSTCDDLNSRKGLFCVNLAVEHDRKHFSAIVQV